MSSIYDEASKLGLLRCNYLWLPKDYDSEYHDIEKMDPPKSCARCKSRYWRLTPTRNVKSRHLARARAVLRANLDLVDNSWRFILFLPWR